jgi:hypothetical protein
VQLLGDALSLAFLRCKGTCGARPALSLEPVEHLVEGADEVRDVAVAGRG